MRLKISEFLNNVIVVLLVIFIWTAPYQRVYPKLCMAGAILLWIGYLCVQHRFEFFKKIIARTPINKILFLFVVMCVLSIILSQNPYHSQKIFFNRYIIYGLCFYLGCFIAQRDKNLAVLTIVLLTFASFLGLGVIRDGFIKNFVERIFTTFGMQILFNMLPIYLLYCAPFCLATAFFSRNLSLRWWAGSNVVLLIMALIIQGSRGAWAGVMAGLLFCAALKNKKVFIGILTGVIVLTGAGLLVPRISGKIQSYVYLRQWSDRLPLYDSAVLMIKDYPIFGSGLGMYEELMKNKKYGLPENYPDSNHNSYIHAHNVYLEVFAESGIIGLLLFLSVFIKFFYNSVRNIGKIQNSIQKSFFIGISSFVLGTLVFAVSSTVIIVGAADAFIFWFLFGAAAAILGRVQKNINSV